MTGQSKNRKMLRQGLRWALFIASVIGIFCIFGDGCWKLVGTLSAVYMLASTIATWIDESREENR